MNNEQIKKMEEFYDKNISEITNFEIAAFIAGEDDTLPDFDHKIGKYFSPDEISIISTTEVPDFETVGYTIKEDSKEKVLETYNRYIEAQFKTMQAIMDIDSDFFKTIEGDCIIYSTVSITGFDIDFVYRINKTDGGITIVPMTVIRVA